MTLGASEPVTAPLHGQRYSSFDLARRPCRLSVELLS